MWAETETGCLSGIACTPSLVLRRNRVCRAELRSLGISPGCQEVSSMNLSVDTAVGMDHAKGERLLHRMALHGECEKLTLSIRHVPFSSHPVYHFPASLLRSIHQGRRVFQYTSHSRHPYLRYPSDMGACKSNVARAV